MIDKEETPIPHEVHSRAVMLMFEAGILLRARGASGLPPVTSSPDFDGGLRIEWINDWARVTLYLSEDDEYIYHEFNDDYGADDMVTARTLVDRLIEMQEVI